MASAAVSPEMETETGVAATTRIVMVVEYEGTRYHGFQLQGKLPTVQMELEKAIEKLTGEKRRIAAASRTDTGVHARAQVVSFRTGAKYSPEIFVRGMNYYLPADIAVQRAYEVNDSFSVRSSAASREYRYSILNSIARSPLRERFSYLVTGRLDVAAMDRAARMLVGTHDFASFVNNIEAAAKGTVRKVYQAEVKREEDLVVFTIVANAFLMHQVRNTVGVLLKVGRGRMSPEDFYEILEAKKPGLAWPTAPARGLCLVRVNYRNSFEDEIC
jgi:tRNA pseudouridine38-40 synthase